MCNAIKNLINQSKNKPSTSINDSNSGSNNNNNNNISSNNRSSSITSTTTLNQRDKLKMSYPNKNNEIGSIRSGLSSQSSSDHQPDYTLSTHVDDINNNDDTDTENDKLTRGEASSQLIRKDTNQSEPNISNIASASMTSEDESSSQLQNREPSMTPTKFPEPLTGKFFLKIKKSNCY
jgi:hypothetical protein